MTFATCVADGLRDKLAAFGPSVEGSSLYLLRAIDITVESLTGVEKLADALVISARALIEEIRSAPVVIERFLDPDDLVINGLESGYKILEERLPALLTNKASIDTNAKLNDGQRELLHSAYATVVDSVATLIEACKDLRAAIISHDLASEKAPTQFYESPGELIDSLHSTSA
jgi:hypothetical protein